VLVSDLFYHRFPVWAEAVPARQVATLASVKFKFEILSRKHQRH
jgi:hypothetical protein